MIEPKSFVDQLERAGVHFFAGVPDSTLSALIWTLEREMVGETHIVAASEGGAVGLAIGHYLATGNVGAVYMQNSGLGNAFNPIVSLATSEVCSIPLVCIIGWRGRAGTKDEPQHRLQGLITEQTLGLIDVPYIILDQFTTDWEDQLTALVEQAHANSKPVAILVAPGVFNAGHAEFTESHGLSREEVLECLTASLPEETLYVATTGKTGRELFEIRDRHQQTHARDFLCVGAMGHANQIAFSVSIFAPKRVVCCIDGDGAFLMHLGNSAITAHRAPPNFLHCVVNNKSHESVGGQPTGAPDLSLKRVAEALGYRSATFVRTESELSDWARHVAVTPGPHFLEIVARIGSRSDLGRPSVEPKNNVASFLRSVGDLP